MRVFAKRWKLIAATVLVVVALTAAGTMLMTKQYASNVQFFVSTSSSDDVAQLAQGSTFSQARVKSYTKLVTTPKVLGPIAKDLGIAGGAKALKKTIQTTVPPDTVMLDVTVTDPSAARAKSVAQRIGHDFPKIVDKLETTKGDKASPVKVTVVDTPTISTTPVSPKPVRNVALGLVLGLLIGIGAAVLRDRLDTLVRTKEDVTELTDTTVLGGIPYDSDAPDHPLVVQANPHHGRAEAFRSLRTNLQFVDATNHPRTLVVTSSLAGEGKTTTTANLALTLAEAGASVCLIEGDLRRPRLLRYLGLEGAVGLTDVLIGHTDLSTVLQPYGEHKLAVLGSGPLPPNPSELLGSPAMKETLGDLRERFDYVLIDAPPLLPVTDAAVTSTLVDGVLVVVGSGIAHRDHVNTALDSLTRVDTTVLGILINRLPRRGAGRRYYDYHYEYQADPADTPGRTSRRAMREHRDKIDAKA